MFPDGTLADFGREFIGRLAHDGSTFLSYGWAGSRGKKELSKGTLIPPDDAGERAEIFLVAMGCS